MREMGECALRESFFHTLKTERIHHRVYDTRDQAKRDIFAYIEGFYNSHRLHSALSFLSPADMERKASLTPPLFRGKITSASESDVGASLELETCIFDESLAKQHGAIAGGRASGMACGGRKESISEEAKEIAWKAQHRLHKRYMKLGTAGKPQGKIITAVARELLGFIWAIGIRAETIAGRLAAA